jgi:hypothetical protein
MSWSMEAEYLPNNHASVRMLTKGNSAPARDQTDFQRSRGVILRLQPTMNVTFVFQGFMTDAKGVPWLQRVTSYCMEIFA